MISGSIKYIFQKIFESKYYIVEGIGFEINDCY